MLRKLSPALIVLLIAIPAYGDDESKTYTAKELEDIVGPVALYPDQVLASVLPASTDPLDVLKASRWLAEQEGEVKEAPAEENWAAAVQALVQFPDVLQWMSENLSWMEQMGYAVSNQQEDVLAAIQNFRKKAKDTGNLETNDKQQVIYEEETQIIQIQPAQPEVIYVPQYDPVYVTQPVATQPASYGGYFWAGFTAGVIGAWAFHEIGWGSHHYGHGYGGGGIYVNKEANFNFNRNGELNRTNIGNINRFQPSRESMRIQPSKPPRGRGGQVGKTRQPQWDKRRSSAKPARGGMKAPARRPTKGTQPRPSFGARPTPSPAVGGSRGTQQGRPTGAARPDRGSSAGRSGLGGSRSGSSARRDSSRGRSSLGSGHSGGSRGGASRGGAARGSGGRSRGGFGGGRGGGGRGRRR